MSKTFKKIRKVVAKFDLGHKLVKGMGLPDPAGDAIYGGDKVLSPAEQAQNTAKMQAEAAERQAQGQAAAAAEAARGQALTTQADAERQRVQREAADQESVTTDAPTVELAGAPGAAAARRKKFQSTSIGGAAGGVSLRV
jgi:hypothetical protein